MKKIQRNIRRACGSEEGGILNRIASLCRVLLVVMILVIAGLPAVFINSAFGYLPVMTLTMALGISAGCTFYMRNKLTAEASASDVSCVRGSSVDIGLKLVNRSALFCPSASARLYISDIFGANDAVRKVHFTIAGRDALDFGFGMSMPHIGLYTVGLEKIDIYGFFGVLKLSVPVSCRFTAAVTPKIRPLDEFHVAEEVLSESLTDTRTTVAGGTDYTGIREYALGDPMKQIHWKLSAHSREYVTKLQESSRQQEFSVVLDFAADGGNDKETMMDINDCLIETALSIIDDISRHDASCTLLFCDRSRNVIRTAPAGRDSDMELVRSFSVLTADPDPTYPDACRILMEEGQVRNRSTNVIAVTSRLTPDLIQELQNIRRQKRIPELYFIVPAAWSEREIRDAASPVRQLSSSEIAYHIIRTNENRNTVSAEKAVV